MEKRFEDIKLDNTTLVHTTGDESITGSKTINDVVINTKGVALTKPGTRLTLVSSGNTVTFLGANDDGRLTANGSALATLADIPAASSGSGSTTQTVQLTYTSNVPVSAAGAQSIALSTATTTNVLDVNVLEPAGGVRPLWAAYYSVSNGTLSITSDANLKAGDTLSWTEVQPATAGGGGGGSTQQVFEFAQKADFPAAGVKEAIYYERRANKMYRWGGSAYQELAPNPTLATTTGVSGLQAMTQGATTTAIGLLPIKTVTGNDLASPNTSGTLFQFNVTNPCEFTLYSDANVQTVQGNWFIIRQIGSAAVTVIPRVPNGLDAPAPTVTALGCGLATTGPGSALLVHKIGPGDNWLVTPYAAADVWRNFGGSNTNRTSSYQVAQWTLGTGCTDNEIGSSNPTVTLGNNCLANKLGSRLGAVQLGTSCWYNTIDSHCVGVQLGNLCRANVLRADCSTITLGNTVNDCEIRTGCSNIVIGDSCSYIVVAEGSSYVRFGANCTRVQVYNTTGSTTTPFMVPDGTTDCIFRNGVKTQL